MSQLLVIEGDESRDNYARYCVAREQYNVSSIVQLARCVPVL